MVPEIPSKTQKLMKNVIAKIEIKKSSKKPIFKKMKRITFFDVMNIDSSLTFIKRRNSNTNSPHRLKIRDMMQKKKNSYETITTFKKHCQNLKIFLKKHHVKTVKIFDAVNVLYDERNILAFMNFFKACTMKYNRDANENFETISAKSFLK